MDQVKEDIVPNSEGFKHITAEKLRDKYTKLEKTWKDAKTMQEQSDFGIREGDCERSINGMHPSSPGKAALRYSWHPNPRSYMSI